MYSLDKSSRKYVCPHCQRKTFVLYLNEDGVHLSPEVGKCDRLDKCNYHYPPRAYFDDHPWLRPSSKLSRPISAPLSPPSSRTDTYLPSYRASSHSEGIRRGAPYIVPGYINPDMLRVTLQRNSSHSLARFLHAVFDDRIEGVSVERILSELGVGTSKLYGGSPVFWQIDQRMRIRTGKIMGYNPLTGKRIKEPRPQFQWVHTYVRKDNPDFQLRQCLFGSHLVSKKDDRRVIWLFESEKAALIATMVLEELGERHTFVPMATGGCSLLNPTRERLRDPYDSLSVLRGRKVVLFPDNGKYGEWKEKSQLLRTHCRELYISSVMEEHHKYPVKTKIECGDGFDDLMLRYISAGRPTSDLVDLLVTSY